ncbi:MAG: DUF6273 domain-containing protein [Anaerococcus prevotii]|uniref:DUF6273 domain-containing protein n=1 Tax=Anaerococcus prevotii TaxID=33034 RepID=UPI0029008ACC|nr:DUF6273 domain-containing protein [Anaerococcus prevotii]MDU2557401.1 DUF6273 domain-containing protein [Anaerococcus prevotii]
MSQPLGNLPVGTLVMDPETKYYGEPIIWKIADKNNASYPADSITLITEKIIALKGMDAREPNNSDSNRKSNGNNNYKLSNMRQWLNSDKEGWYKAQHEFDQAPIAQYMNSNHNPYEKEAGFLSNFSESFLLNLVDTKLKVSIPSVDGGGYETLTDKIFLASRTEVGLGNEGSESEGSKFALFTNDSSRVAVTTQGCYDNSTYKNSSYPAGSKDYWWLRTPYTSNSGSVRIVNSSGSLDNGNAHSGYIGLRPLCNLKSEILVSDDKNSDGVYTLEFAPAIPDNLEIRGSSEDLGEKDSEFELAYTPIGPRENASVKVVEILDGQEKRQYTVTSGTKTSFKIEKDEWKEILNGQHTIIIKADDGTEKAEKTFKFSKNETEILLELKNPMESVEMPTKAIVQMIASIPSGATSKVEICNNAFDNNVVWQDVTKEAKSLENIEFKNKNKTAENWGVNIRVNIKRNSAEGSCFISNLNMKFE